MEGDIHQLKKPGPKIGSGKKPVRFNMRTATDFGNCLSWIRQNERSVFHDLKPAAMLEQMVRDHIMFMEVCNGQRYDPNVKY